MNNQCLCGKKIPFLQCCDPYLKGTAIASTPEQLMRSRYSAYALGGYGEFLLKTWFPPMASGMTAAELSKRTQQWLSLEILGSGSKGTDGWVEFKATYQHNSVNSVMHERSIFSLIDGRWLYIGGEVTYNS